MIDRGSQHLNWLAACPVDSFRMISGSLALSGALLHEGRPSWHSWQRISHPLLLCVSFFSIFLYYLSFHIPHIFLHFLLRLLLLLTVSFAVTFTLFSWWSTLASRHFHFFKQSHSLRSISLILSSALIFLFYLVIRRFLRFCVLWTTIFCLISLISVYLGLGCLVYSRFHAASRQNWRERS